MTKNNDNMVLYEVLTPEKLAELISGGKAGDSAPENKAEDASKEPVSAGSYESSGNEAAAEPEYEDVSFETEAEKISETPSADESPSTAEETPQKDDNGNEADDEPKTMQVIDVRFQDGGKTYFFDPGDFPIKTGDGVIVETSRGIEFGDVTQGCHGVLAAQIVGTLKPIMRIATEQDREQRDKYRAKEKDAFQICAQKILEHNLDMKLVNVEYAFTGAKIVFYFTADGRIDFRELVKDLASVFKTRIELRQIGVRDEAKLLGGLGSCGRPVCCKQFLPDFQPVSIKMAKEQSLSLSPTKISGICGRLMCCLKYEQDTYEAMRKRMPRIGREVVSPEGQGTVLENNIITEKTRLRMVLPDGTIDVRWYPFEELSNTDAPRLEPAPRPPKVERLSRRERMLQEQKARKEAAAQEEAAALAGEAVPEDAAEAEAVAGEVKRKRPRRNRKRHTGPRPEGSAEQTAPESAASPSGEAE